MGYRECPTTKHIERCSTHDSFGRHLILTDVYRLRRWRLHRPRQTQPACALPSVGHEANINAIAFSRSEPLLISVRAASHAIMVTACVLDRFIIGRYLSTVGGRRGGKICSLFALCMMSTVTVFMPKPAEIIGIAYVLGQRKGVE